MTVTGKQLIGGEWVPGAAGTFCGVDPRNGSDLQPAISIASSEQVDETVRMAEAAARIFRRTSPHERAEFLRSCAGQIMALGDALLERIMAETGYPKGRAEGERGRTCGQLNMFADYIEAGDYLDARIDTAQPQRQPAPRPDLRLINQPIGPVVVFGASNFPLAFSVAGGDTASALAAGCPVVCKAHPGHPGTSRLAAEAITAAAKTTNMPDGVFGLLFDDAIERHLFGVKPIIAAWVAGGILILALGRWIAARRDGMDLAGLTWRAAVLIGFIQAIAMWPGGWRREVTRSRLPCRLSAS